MQLPQLKTLYLMDNSLTFVPSWLGRSAFSSLFHPPRSTDTLRQHNAPDAARAGPQPDCFAAPRDFVARQPRDSHRVQEQTDLSSESPLAPLFEANRSERQLAAGERVSGQCICGRFVFASKLLWQAIVNDVRKTQALLETIDLVCEDKSSFAPSPSAPPLSSPRREASPPPSSPRSVPTPPRSAPAPPASLGRSAGNISSNSSGRTLRADELVTVDDVQMYFLQLGASEETLELLRAEQVDGAALALFTPAELRENFKLSLGVLKKHTDGVERKSRNAAPDNEDLARQERDAEEARRRAERENDEIKRQADRAVHAAEREAEEARRRGDRDAANLDYEHKRRVQAERELEEAKRKLERDEVERRVRAAEDDRRRKEDERRREEERRAARPPVSPRSSPPPSSPRTGVKCKTCHREMLPGESYVKKKGRTYCQEHGYDKCKGCRGPLTGTYSKLTRILCVFGGFFV